MGRKVRRTAGRGGRLSPRAGDIDKHKGAVRNRGRARLVRVHCRSAAREGWLVYAAGVPRTMRPLLAALAILVAWTLLDFLLHRLLLAPIYEASPDLWRPIDQMNVALIYAVTFVLIGVFV